MATTSKPAKTKKPAAKKPAAKKPAAKKPAAKKPAAKKPVAKKAAAKKPAAKKAAIKKPAAKKPAAKKPAVKKPAAKKAAVKKPAVKKPVAKKAAPAVKKPAVKKPAVKKPVAQKPAAVKPAAVTKPVVNTIAPKPAVKPSAPAAAVESGTKGLNLFDAFSQEKLPRNSGYIVSSFFKEGSTYSVYEIVSYSDVKEITSVGNGLQFTAKSKKLCVLVEPPAYTEKHVEPLNRKEGESIPYSESELEIIKGIDQTRIMVSREPKEGPGSFTVLKPAGSGFSVVFNALPDIHQKLSAFFKYSLNLERRIPLWDAEKAAQLISRTVEKTLSFQGAL